MSSRKLQYQLNQRWPSRQPWNPVEMSFTAMWLKGSIGESISADALNESRSFRQGTLGRFTSKWTGFGKNSPYVASYSFSHAANL